MHLVIMRPVDEAAGTPHLFTDLAEIYILFVMVWAQAIDKGIGTINLFLMAEGYS